MENEIWTNLTESLTLKGVNITGDVLGRFGIYTVKQYYENESGKTLEVFYALKKFKGKKTLVLLTDGQVGKAYCITEWIRRNIGENRLFVFGIDSAVNYADLTSFAKAGRGKAEFFTPDEYLDSKIARQFSRINGYECAAASLNCRRNKTDDVLTYGKKYDFFDF